LYGHGEQNVCLSVPSDVLAAALRHGGRLVGLTGAVTESAFIRALQWDTYGTHVLHVDFTRINLDELVKVGLTIELRGQAPGVKEGGAIEHLVHEVQVECPAGSIPDKLYISINNLKLNDSVTIGQIELPANAKVFGDPETIVVQCIVPVERPEEEAGEGGAAEPEVIGAKKEEEAEEE
jgi:large subunit ribosomal protein L25